MNKIRHEEPLTSSLSSAVSRLFGKYFWILSLLIYSITVLIAYGFIKNLYFYQEDFGHIYTLLFGGENQPFPYQGIKYLIYPLFLIFADRPSGYFQVALFFYILLSLFLAWAIWKFTKSKSIAFISGLLFAAGYIGSESLFKVELAIPEIIYLFCLLGVLFFYKNYIDFHRLRSWMIALSLYAFPLMLISQRAPTLLFILFLADLLLAPQKKAAPSYKNVVSRLKRLSPFILVFLTTYIGIPLVLHGKIANYIGTYDILNKNSYLLFLSNIGNYLVPFLFQEKIVELLQKLNYSAARLVILGTAVLLLVSSFVILRKFLTRNKKCLAPLAIFLTINVSLLARFSGNDLDFLLGSLIGYFLLILILVVYFFLKINPDARKFFLFLSLSWFSSSLFYHLYEADWLHVSTHRYNTSGFLFFAPLIAFVIIEIFGKLSTRKLSKAISFGLALIVFSSYLSASYLSPLKQGYLERSFYLQKFIHSLKSAVPRLGTNNNLFYFDVAYDPGIKSLFRSYLYTGGYSDETALAMLYKEKKDQLKIVYDYSSFTKERTEKSYNKAYVFFYNDKNELRLAADFSQSVMDLRSVSVDDYSNVKVGLYYNLGEAFVQRLEGQIIFDSREASFPKDEEINNILELDLQNYDFPSYKPIRLEMTLAAIGQELNNAGLENLNIEGGQNLSISVYPITDKYLYRSQSPPAKNQIYLDGKERAYSFTLLPGGTKLKSLLIEFPNTPILAKIGKIFLTQMD